MSARLDTLRPVVTALLGASIAAAFFWLFATHHGREYLDVEHLRRTGLHFREVVRRHPISAATLFICLYMGIGFLALPVWWLQIIGGWGFGLFVGTFVCQIAATIVSAWTVAVSHQLVGGWFEKNIESRRAAVAALDDKLGSNGLLVVMAVRLLHVIPFGASNYVMGLTRIRPREAAIGTLLGNIPAVSFYVGIGAGYRPWSNWRFMAALAAVNLILLIPLALRYFRPHWFGRIGLQ